MCSPRAVSVKYVLVTTCNLPSAASVLLPYASPVYIRDPGSCQPTQRRGDAGLPPSTAPARYPERPSVNPALPHGHREAVARVPAATGGGAVPRKGRVPRRHQERERARDQRKLAPAHGLRALQAHLLAGTQASFRSPFGARGQN